MKLAAPPKSITMDGRGLLAFEANDTAGVDTVRTAVQRPAREVREIVAGAVPMR